MRTQLSSSVSPETREAYTRLARETGLGKNDLMTQAVPLLERHFGQADLVAGYVQVARQGDAETMTCAGCGRQVLSLAWLAVMAGPEAIHLNGPYCPGCAA